MIQIKNVTTGQYFFAGTILALLCLMLFPVNVLRVQNTAKEDPKYIRRIYDTHTVGQVFTHSYYTISSMDVLMRSDTAQHSMLLVKDSSGTEIASIPVELTSDDQWVNIRFAKKLPKGTDVLTFSTISGTTNTQAILIRFQPDSSRYDQGNMMVDGNDSYGDIAFRLTERLPLWHALLVRGQVNATSVYAASKIVLKGVLFAMLLFPFIFTWNNRWKNARVVVPVIAIFIGTIFMCAPYVATIQGVFGGDAFNYLFKAYALVHGHDPFAADPRKGPFFSLLLIPGLFMLDPLAWSRWVGIIFAAATAALVPLVAKKMGIPWIFSIIAGVLVAGNSFLLFEAPDALAVTTFTFLILLSVYAYLSIATHKQWLWVLAVTTGLIMLTRFEGALVGAVLLPAAWMRYRVSWKKMIWRILLAGAIMAMPLSSFMFSGVSGIRTAQDISNDDGLFLVHSIHDEQLTLNIQRSYEFFTNVFIQRGDIMSIAQWLLLGFVLGAGILVLQRWLPRSAPQLLAGLGIGMAAGFLFLLMMNNEVNRAILVASMYVLVGIGMAVFLRKKPIDTLAIILAIAAQVAVIIWILPKDRYFLPTIPFLYVFLIYGITPFIPSKKKWVQLFALVMMCTAAIFFFQDITQHLPKKIEAYNNKAQETDVLLKALLDLRTSNKNVAVESLDDLAVQIYIPQQFFYQLKEPHSVDQELQFIRDHHIQLLLKRGDSKDWHITSDHPEIFSDTKTYTTKNGDATVVVYSVK